MSTLSAAQRRYLFWTLYSLSHIGLFVYGVLRQMNDPGMMAINSIGSTIFVSRGAGLVITLDVLLILLPMCRNLMTLLRSLSFLNSWIDFDATLFLHKVSACSMLVFTIIHTNGHYANFFGVESNLFSVLHLKAWQVHYSTYAGLTGHAMLILMFLMFTATYAKVKTLKFEIFW
jgi:NADPH oxidase